MWPEWDDPRVCLGGRQQRKYRSSFLIWILQTKGNIKSDLAAWVLMAFSPSHPLPLSIFCAPPWEASRQKCALAELYSYKTLLTTDKGKKPSVIKRSSDKHTHSHKSAILFQAGLSVMSLLRPPAQRSVVPTCHWSLSVKILFIGNLSLFIGKLVHAWKWEAKTALTQARAITQKIAGKILAKLHKIF